MALVAAGCASTPFLGSGFEVHKKKLKNGLTAVMVVDRSVPIVSYSTWYRVGAAWEKPGATGIAHLFEHLMFKGTPRFDGKAFFNLLESRGAQVNAYTQRDMTVFYEVAASKHLGLITEMEADRMANLVLDEGRLETERKVVLEERRLRLDGNFDAQHMEELRHLAFPSHPYGMPVIGYEEDIRAIDLQACRDFYRRYYQPGNAVVALAGDFDADEAWRDIERRYGALPGRPVEPLRLEAEAPFEGERRKTIFRPVEAEAVLMGYRVPAMDHPDMPALTMLSWALFGLSSSRANETLVREKQVAISVVADVEQGLFPGLFIIGIELRRGHPAEGVQGEIDALIRDAKASPLAERELERVKNRLAYEILASSKSAPGIASLMAHGVYFFGDHRESFERLEALKAVTLADLLRVARLYLNDGNRAVVYMKPLGGGRS